MDNNSNTMGKRVLGFIGPTTQKPPLARSCNILHMENISIEIMQQMLLNSLKINKQQI